MPPPPWTLTGRGWIAAFLPAPDAPLGALMLLRYAASPVGPYDELLWVAWGPGPRGWRPQVRAIVVSSAASVAWGRRNWNLPKRPAHFEWQGDWTGSREAGQVCVTGEDDREVARLAFRAGGPQLPVSTALIPAPLRTLAQPALEESEGWRFTRVGGSGHATPAHLTVLSAGGLHPALTQRRPRLTLALPDFRLVFPVPQQA